jgi:hypothetical protein
VYPFSGVEFKTYVHHLTHNGKEIRTVETSTYSTAQLPTTFELSVKCAVKGRTNVTGAHGLDSPGVKK